MTGSREDTGRSVIVLPHPIAKEALEAPLDRLKTRKEAANGQHHDTLGASAYASRRGS
jgi:hypothetical protein